MRHLDNVCFITYEEMKSDLAAVVRKVSSFLGRPVPEQNIPALVDHLSFDKMKKNAAVNKQEFVEVNNAWFTAISIFIKSNYVQQLYIS